jgi:hypothetical protein
MEMNWILSMNSKNKLMKFNLNNSKNHKINLKYKIKISKDYQKI